MIRPEALARLVLVPDYKQLSMKEIKHRYFLQTLITHDFNTRKTAKALKISERAARVYKKALKASGLRIKETKTGCTKAKAKVSETVAREKALLDLNRQIAEMMVSRLNFWSDNG